MVQAWEQDWTKPNPFESKQRRKLNIKLVEMLLTNVPGITENQVRLELAQDDASSIRNSSLVVHEHLPGSVLITQGLELEEQQ